MGVQCEQEGAEHTALEGSGSCDSKIRPSPVKFYCVLFPQINSYFLCTIPVLLVCPQSHQGVSFSLSFNSPLFLFALTFTNKHIVLMQLENIT